MPRPHKVRKCLVCRNEFYPRAGTEKCCSRKCEGERRQSRLAATCEHCHKPFTSPKARPRKYCSRECYVAGHEQPTMLKPKKCKHCRKEFQPSWSGRKYCSKKCGNDAKKTIPEQHCEVCHKKIKSRGQRRRFCSRKCCVKAPREKVLEPKTCEHCQNEFEPRWSTQRFCSRRCGYDNRTKERPKLCEHCKKPMRGNQSPTTRFCSYKCGALGRKKATRVKHPVGTVIPSQDGYFKIKVGEEYPGNQQGWMPHHRYVMEQHLGRTLHPWETVHHKHGDRSNNDIYHLELWSGRHLKGVRVTDLVKFVVTYYPDLVAAELS